MIKLVQGTVLTNKQICDLFHCSSQGGMRRSKKTNTLVLISNHLKSEYNDVWQNNILYYTGMGQTGDQSLEFAQNKTLANVEKNGVQLHFFEVLKKYEYTYIGEMLKAGEPYSAEQLDSENKLRRVYIFPLKLKQGSVPNEILNHHEVESLMSLRKLSDKLLITKVHAQLSYQNQNSKITVTTPRYRRSMELVEYVKRRAHGICDLCNQPAPFIGKDQQPYLECHHIVWLSKNGADTLNNVVALCPNCHRKMHIVQDENDVKKLTVVANDRMHVLDMEINKFSI